MNFQAQIVWPMCSLYALFLAGWIESYAFGINCIGSISMLPDVGQVYSLVLNKKHRCI